MFILPETKVHAPVDVEKKSYSGNGSFVDYLRGNGNYDLAAYACIVLYKKAMPFFNAVSLRAETVAQVPPRVWDKKAKEYIEDHPILELLQTPNADLTYTELAEALSSFLDITGDSFIGATGRISKAPLELYTIGPHLVDFDTTNSQFGVLNVSNKISVQRGDGSPYYFRPEEFKTLGIRYLNKAMDNDLWHIRTFNPLRSSVNFRGTPRAQSVFAEIQQYISGNVNNLSNLKRGTRLSMAWVNTNNEELTDKQWDRMQEEAAKYSGDSNAGGTPVLDGMDVKTIQQTNRDMQFKELQEEMLARISTIYRVPLGLLMAKTMTLNNLQTSMVQLFDMATLPQTSRLFQELTRFLMPRYSGSENLELRYNENDMTALKIRILESTEALSRINVNTPNEIRARLGDEPLTEGGDDVYRPAGNLPLGASLPSVVEEEDFEDEPEEDDELTKARFELELYRKGYSPEEITEQMKRLGFTSEQD